MESPVIKRSKKIVLAEGEAVITEILPQFLKPAGYEVITTADGQDALKIIKRELPDLIILDSDLTRIDGLALCKILKSDFLTSYIPIILLIDQKQIRKKVLEIKEGIDDYIFKPPDPIDLQIRLEMALRRSDHQMHANSLTRLPGNKAIEITIRQRLKDDKPFSFLYLDINNFKSFNDTYGYLRGDGVIMQAARIITNAVSERGNKNDFVGHVGGDDFVVVTTPEKEKSIAEGVISEFDRLIPLHYSKEDRLAGYLAVKDRQDNEIKAPIMGISVAVVNNCQQKIQSVIQITEIASEIKRHLKTLEGSNFLANRRVFAGKSKSHRSQTPSTKTERHARKYKEDPATLPIGQLLLRAKLIDEKQLQEALFEHWSSRTLLGQTLIKMGLVKKEDIAPFLAKYPEK